MPPKSDDLPALDSYRNLLFLLAQSQLVPALRRKIDPDDLVQEVLTRAVENLAELREQADPLKVKSWLLAIFSNILKDHLKHYTADKRDLYREQSIAASLEQSSLGIDAFLAADKTSPSMAAARNEDIDRLANSLRQLPEEMREVVILKHINGQSIKDIAQTTGRTTASVAGLLRRGLALLRQHLH